MGVNYSKLELEYFLRLFDIKETKFKLIVFKMENDNAVNASDVIDKFALKNIAYDILDQSTVYLSTILDNNILLLN